MIMGYVKAALKAFDVSSIITKAIVILALLGVLATSYGVWHHRIYQSGVDATVLKIAKGDAKLVDRALKYRSKLKECQALDRDWDQTTGRCR